MNKITTHIIVLAATLAGLISCHGKRGNGHVITEDRAIAPFTKLTVTGVFPVEISQHGGKETVKVQTDENLQKLITVTNDGDELIIKSREDASIRSSSKMKIYVNVKNLRELDFSSVGSLSTDGNLKFDSLYVSTESVGKLDIDIT